MTPRWAGLSRVRELPRPLPLLIGTQLAFNAGFYLVLPFLAGHLAGDLALAGWVVGLVLGCARSASRACSRSAGRWPTGSARNR